MTLPNFTNQDPTTYKVNIDAEIAANQAALAFKGAMVTNNANQTITAAADIRFQTENYDTDGFHVTPGTALDARFTIPSGVSKVRLTANIGAVSTVVDGHFQIALKLNGGNPNYGGFIKRQEFMVDNKYSLINVTSGIIEVTAGQYLTCQASHTSTGTVNVLSNASTKTTFFSIEVIE